jgi:radical SAM superfamily enzyme YgiQ (UPF0313 family)
MKIVFVLPYQNYGLEPLGILYLAGMLKEAGHEVQAVPPNKRVLARVFRVFQPDILAYSVISGWHQQYVALNRWIRAELVPKALSIFGGPHPTYFPTFIYEDGVDAICIGEGEQAFIELAAKLQKQEDYFTTKNWWFKHDDTIHTNPLRPEIEVLDDLPFPDRSILAAYPSYINRALRAFIVSRGCPYNCSYCFNHAYRQLYKGNGLMARVRRRSVNNLITEIQQVRREYGMRSVTFFDDVFVTSSDWLDEFAVSYRQKVGLPFECNLRVEQVTPQAVSALKRAGCIIIAIGIETADEGMRASVLRRHYTNDQLRRACAFVREQGIFLKTYNILGLPPGGVQADWATLKLNIALQVDIPTASLLQPYPGTDLGDKTKQEDYWDGDMKAIALGFYSTSPLRIRERTKIEMLHKLFFVGGKFPVLLPLLALFLRLADFAFVRKATFWTYQEVNRLALLIGRNIVFAEEWKHAVLKMLARHEDRLG